MKKRYLKELSLLAHKHSKLFFSDTKFYLKEIQVIKSNVILALCLFSANLALAEEIEIKRSVGGDKGKYYLLSVEKNGNLFEVIHKRIGLDSTGFSKTKINCSTKQYQDLGYGEDSINNIKEYPSVQWTSLVSGSSKSDLVNFVCSKYK